MLGVGDIMAESGGVTYWCSGFMVVFVVDVIHIIFATGEREGYPPGTGGGMGALSSLLEIFFIFFPG